MSKSWLRYIVLSRKVMWIFLAVMYTALSFSLVLIENVKGPRAVNLVIGTAVTLDMVLAFVLPELEFSFVHRRKSADQFFALPVSRRKVLITTLGYLFVLNYGLFLLVTLLAFLFFGSPFAQTGWVIAGILLVGLLDLVVLCVNTFWYLLANNVFDGVVMIAAYSFVPLLLWLTMDIFFTYLITGNAISSVPFLNQLYLYLSPFLSGVTLVIDTFERAGGMDPERNGQLLRLILLILYFAISLFGLRKEFIDRKSERADQVSDGKLAYPLIIHLYLFCCLMTLSSAGVSEYLTALPMYAALLVCYVIAMAVYRRKVKVTLKNLLVFFGGLACSIVITFAAYQTEGFGFPYLYDLREGDKLVYSYMNYDGDAMLDDVFYVSIPTDQIDAYSDVIEALEDAHHTAIHDSYDHAMNDIGVRGDLNVMSVSKKKVKTHTYHVWHVIDEETMEILRKHPEILHEGDAYYPPYTGVFSLF